MNDLMAKAENPLENLMDEYAKEKVMIMLKFMREIDIYCEGEFWYIAPFTKDVKELNDEQLYNSFEEYIKTKQQ